MVRFFGKLFGPAPVPQPLAPAMEPGARAYVVGDVHGRLDCLDALLHAIEQDRAGYTGAVELIFLGDLIDRGPDSRGVVQRLLDLAAQGAAPQVLMGNHEEVLLLVLSGDLAALPLFERMGGRATALSYGIAPDTYDAADTEGRVALLTQAVPAAHRDFISSFGDKIMLGDYLFVHAGVRPGISLANQARSDLRWIRRSFLEHEGSFEALVVHGHTVTPEVSEQANRIGIDTGAFRTGRLTALVLEGTTRRYLQTALAAADAPGTGA